MKNQEGMTSPFDELTSTYDSWFDEDGKLVFSIEQEAFTSLLPTLPKPWLEIGVGTGRFAQALGIETGIDPSSESLKLAQQRGIKTLQGKGEKTGISAASMGTVFIITTLCFVDSPREVLLETNRILAPGGKLVLGLMLKESSWGRFYHQKKIEGHRFYQFATIYTYEEVKSMLQDTGFYVEKTISTLFQPPGKVEHQEKPQTGYFAEAGFIVLQARK